WRLDRGQQRTGAVLLIRVMLLRHFAGGHRQGGDQIPDQEARPLVKANDGVLRVVGFGVERQHGLHPGQKQRIDLRDTPGALQVRLEFVFLSTVATWVPEMCSQYFNSTAFSASRSSFHRACPSGAGVQQSAVILGRVSPSISMGRPERGASYKHPNFCVSYLSRQDRMVG